MNKRVKTKRNKRFLIDSIIESPFIENGFHWAKTQFDAGVKWREYHFGKTDRLVVDTKVNFAVYLTAMFDAPHLALKILESVYQFNPNNSEVASELIECYLVLDKISDAASVFEKFNNFNASDPILEYSDFVTGVDVWSNYRSSGLTQESIRLINVGDYSSCLQLLASQSGVESELLKLCMFGAKDDHEKFINQLRFVVNNYSDIYRDYKFWFYRTSDSTSDPEYWDLCNHRSFSKIGVSMVKTSHGLEWSLCVE